MIERIRQLWERAVRSLVHLLPQPASFRDDQLCPIRVESEPERRNCKRHPGEDAEF